LQSQINQIIAPSGEAPSAAEVQNARIGADGVTYDSLGDAIRNNDNTIKANLNANREALDNGYLLYPDYFVRGNITNNGSESNLSYRIKSTNKISFDKQTTYKIKNGFEVKKIIWDASTGTLQPSDTWYTDSIVFNTGNLYKLVIKRTTENISEVADVTTFAQVVYRNNNTDDLLFNEVLPANSKAVGKALQFSPYGIEPFQTSFFKPSQNLFSNFCYFINRRYYGVSGVPTQTKNPMQIKPALNWKGWLIKVKPNTTYTVGPCDFLITFFNIDLISDKIIQTSDLSDTSETTITSGETSHWMALTQRIERNMDDWMMVEGDTYPSEYVSGYPQWVNTPKSVTDKTIAFFGDSITAGSGWTGEPDSQGYHQYIHDLYGFTCLNYGYGGSGYIYNYDGDGGLRGIGQPGRGVSNSSGAFTPNNVEVRLTEVTPSDLDGVVIFAGTNDWSHQVSIADFETALDRIFEYYQTNFGTVPLLIMTPIHRLGDEGTTSRPIPLINYVNSVIQKCREHGIPYIDTFTMSGLQPNNSGNSAVFFPRDDNSSHTIDGIHPNHLAHQRLARCIGETLNQMMLWDETAIR
jgi:lysophospholipase L1-like esterase